MTEHSAVIAATHPCLAGHFPGNPLVPGVVILQQVIGALETELPCRAVVGISHIKFLRPLSPAQPFSIAFRTSGEDRVRFECVSEEGSLAHGTLVLAPR